MRDNDTVAVKNGVLITPFQRIENGVIIIENGVIKAVAGEYETRIPSDAHILDAGGRTVIPGFIDINGHGRGGDETLCNTYDAINEMARLKPENGTTGFLLTTITAPQEELLRTAKVVKGAVEKGTEGAQVLGMHLEGPYINVEKRGGHNEEYVRKPYLKEVDELIEASGNRVKLITLAPELEGGLEFIKGICQRGIVASVGHSNATYEQMISAVKAGLSHACHTYNGMRDFNHREPGILGAVLTIDEITNEIIADGVHVHPAAVKMLVRCKGLDKIILVAAGSGLMMNIAVRNIMDFCNLSLQDAVRMATVNPAKRIGVSDRKGSLEVGKDADIAIVDNDLNVRMTIIKGKEAYER